MTAPFAPGVSDFLDSLPDGGDTAAPEPAAVPEPATPEPAAVAPEAAAPVAEPAHAAAAPAAPAAPAEPGAEPDVFPRDYVEELRREAGTYRTKAKPFLDAFDGYDEEAQSEMLAIVRDLVAAPETAAQRMLEVSKALLGDQFEDVLKGGPRPLTQDDLEREFARREAQRAEQQAVEQVQQEARTLGYQDESPEQVMLFGLAAKFHGGDLQAADKFLKDLRQVAVDEFLASKQQQGSAYPPVVTEGTPAGGEKVPTTFDEARAALLNSL